MGLSGPLFRRGCFQLFTEQGLLGLENGEEETVFNFGMSQTASFSGAHCFHAYLLSAVT